MDELKMKLTSKILDLQAAANAHGWTITAVEMPQVDASRLFEGAPSAGPAGTIDGMQVTVGPDWKGALR